jgi:hypothetical protein
VVSFVQLLCGGRHAVLIDDRRGVVVEQRQLDEHEDEHVDQDKHARDVGIKRLVVGIVVVQRHEH